MKLTEDEKELINDGIESVRAASKLLGGLIDRHVQKLLTAPLKEPMELVVLRARIDGMKDLIHEYEQLIKSNRS